MTPILLHIESSSITCGVALSMGQQVVTEFVLHQKNVHSQKLASLIDNILSENQIKPAQLNGIALSAGPGSFTGLRIGFSIVKGLVYALNIPIMPISTLRIWAYQAGHYSGKIVPIIDARRGEVFTAQYQWQNNSLKETVAPTLLLLEQLPQWLPEGPVLLTGRDALSLLPNLQPHLSQQVDYRSAPFIQLWALAELGIQAYIHKEWENIKTIEPMYMRAFKGVL